jgi:hypothetical protein
MSFRKALFWCAGLCALALPAAVTRADAVVVGPVYPPPGGVTFSGSGAGAPFAGGKTWSYSGFGGAGTAYQDLWWGSSSPITLAMDGSVNSSGETLTFNSFSGNQAIWTGSSTMQTINGNFNVDTQFVLTASQNFEAPPAGLSNGADIHVNGNYNVNLSFQAKIHGDSSWSAANDLFNSYHTNPATSVISNFSGGFYYTAPVLNTDPNAAPLPASSTAGLGLLGGLGTLCLARRKWQKGVAAVPVVA